MAHSPLIRTQEDFWNVVFSLIFIGLYIVLYVWMERNGTMPRSIGVFDFFLLIFSTYRIIRLITYDKITDFIRDFFSTSTTGLGKTIHSLIICIWCTGIWATLFVTTLYYATNFGWLFLLILSVSGIASFIQVITNAIIRNSEKSIMEKEFLKAEISGTPTEPTKH